MPGVALAHDGSCNYCASACNNSVNFLRRGTHGCRLHPAGRCGSASCWDPARFRSICLIRKLESSLGGDLDRHRSRSPPENKSTQAVSVLSPLVARVLGSAASSRAIALFRNRKFADSALDGGGFEPVVPLRWRSPEREVKIDGAPVVTAK